MKNILSKQQRLQQVIGIKHGEPILYNKGDIVHYIKEHAFFMSEEVTELMLAVGDEDRAILKPWSVNHKLKSKEKFVSTPEVKSEAMDMLCFCMNICLAVGITPDNVDEEFDKVWNKSMQRQKDGY